MGEIFFIINLTFALHVVSYKHGTHNETIKLNSLSGALLSVRSTRTGSFYERGVEMEKIRAIYFCDIDDDNEQETRSIQTYLASVIGLDIPVEMTTLPPFKERFDILFFDWGGMSMGNSMLEHFCGNIIECAEDNPGRIFVMTSSMTKYAMMEALHELEDRPNNIYLDIEKAKMPLACFTE